MKALLRIYLVLIFASTARDAGSANDSINSVFPLEGSNFAINTNYPQGLGDMADSIKYSAKLGDKVLFETVDEKSRRELPVTR